MSEWSYLPDKKEIEIYRNIYRQFYDRKLNRIFDLAVALHKNQFVERISFRQMIHENFVEVKKVEQRTATQTLD